MANDTIIIIKLKSLAPQLGEFRRFLRESLADGPAYYNITSEPDKETFNKLYNPGEQLKCAFLDYQEENISRIYWTNAELIKSDRGYSISCHLIYDTESISVIRNFESCLDLDLKRDFAVNSYIAYETSTSLSKQMMLLEIRRMDAPIVSRTYDAIADELQLCPLAQKNEYCIRQYNLKKPDTMRGEYQRDYDRILYSKSFRRMVDKAQIFSSAKGDHFRTRMTHTLLVCQIARSICCALRLNRSLTEAIAIGHDLGHTPFGHAGERALHSILTGQNGFDVAELSINGGFPYGGFKHNYQGLRVATFLENAYPEVCGMDLSYQTLDGILNHTKSRQDVDITEFTKYQTVFVSDHPVTLEGQVVFIADEIAQRSHDIDDAMSSGLITFAELCGFFQLSKYPDLNASLKSIETSINFHKKLRYYSDENELLYTRISAEIVKYFVNDVILKSIPNIEAYNSSQFNDAGHFVDKLVIEFSDGGIRLCKYLEKILNNKVISSSEVSLFDSNASKIIHALFQAYYKNPMLLHNGTLRRLYMNFLESDIRDVIEFKEGNSDLVRDEWKRIITNPVINGVPSIIDGQIICKRKILVRTICDFIAGMTDSYALNEYHKLYNL